MIDTTPRFLNGVFSYAGQGYEAASLLHASLVYVVPADKRAQLIYLRAGNAGDELIYLAMMQDGRAVRLFPVGAKASTHVPLAVVEDLQPDTRIEIHMGGRANSSGVVIVDIGLIEI